MSYDAFWPDTESTAHTLSFGSFGWLKYSLSAACSLFALAQRIYSGKIVWPCSVPLCPAFLRARCVGCRSLRKILRSFCCCCAVLMADGAFCATIDLCLERLLGAHGWCTKHDSPFMRTRVRARPNCHSAECIARRPQYQ